MNHNDIESTLNLTLAGPDEGPRAEWWKRLYHDDVSRLLLDVAWMEREIDRLTRELREEHAAANRWRFHHPGSDLPG